jgi:hypothetical protein
MNPYLQNAQLFSDAYQAQMQASNAMARVTAPAEQEAGYVANTSSSQPYGSPQPARPQNPLTTLDQFDTDLDTRVALVREELLNRAKKEVEDSRKRFSF